MATLVYPMGGDGGDFVAFGHAKYTRNRVGNARTGAPPPMGNAIRLYMPTSTPEVTNDNGWGPLSNPGPVGQAMQDAAATVGARDIGSGLGTGITGLANGFQNIGGAAHQLGVGYLAR